MKYTKTLDLWSHNVQLDIMNGKLKLQRGQWLVCGAGSQYRCRYVSHTTTSINVVHWQGSPLSTRTLFDKRIKALKTSKGMV